MSEQRKKAFVDEKIKQKPLAVRRILQKIIVSALCGAAFAVAFSVVFLGIRYGYVALKGQEGTAEGGQETKITSGAEENSQREAKQKTTESDEGKGKDPQKQKNDIQKKQESSAWTMGDYQEFERRLYRIGENMKSAMVEVGRVSKTEDWFDSEDSVVLRQTGIIIREDSSRYYILSEKKESDNPRKIYITFNGGITAEAEKYASDTDMGLAVIAVEKKNIPSTIQLPVSVADFSGEKQMNCGDAVIAVGNIQGSNSSVQDGAVTSTEKKMSAADRNYSIITTNIVSEEGACAVLLDLEGKIIGVARQQYGEGKRKNTLTAVPAAELAPVIDRLASGGNIPCLGLHIKTVTESLAKTFGMPQGVFVQSVLSDSPAMKGGIQGGDVVISINGQTVRTEKEYSNIVFGLKKKDTCKVEVMRKTGAEYKQISCELKVSVR